MRSRGSIGGPLILIAIGILFLIHTFSPEFRIGEMLTNDWPYFLILWGVVQLVEVLIRAFRGAPLPSNGISGGAWLAVLLVCLVGLANSEFRRPDTWWRRAGFDQSVQMFGDAHDYSLPGIQKTVGPNPHILIESFRGDAKIGGSEGTVFTLNGRKVVRALNATDADRANMDTPVDVLVQGNTIVIRCNQDKAGRRSQVITDLDLSVPRGASVEATGRVGDFDVSSVSGDVDLTSENGEMRLRDLNGNVKVSTNKSSLVRCTNVRGAVAIRGRGSDVDLSKIAGPVTISGDYNGTLSLHQIASPVRVESMRTELNVQRVPGEITLARGSLEVRNVVGPVAVSTQSTDVTLNGFTNALDLSVDKGDIELRPGRLPLSKMAVHARSGNIELALPQNASFALSASTEHGDIENQFGDALSEKTQGHGSRLQGSIGTGPAVSVATDRGSVTIRKSSADEDATDASEPHKPGVQTIVELKPN